MTHDETRAALVLMAVLLAVTIAVWVLILAGVIPNDISPGVSTTPPPFDFGARP